MLQANSSETLKDQTKVHQIYCISVSYHGGVMSQEHVLLILSAVWLGKLKISNHILQNTEGCGL